MRLLEAPGERGWGVWDGSQGVRYAVPAPNHNIWWSSADHHTACCGIHRTARQRAPVRYQPPEPIEPSNAGPLAKCSKVAGPTWSWARGCH